MKLTTLWAMGIAYAWFSAMSICSPVCSAQSQGRATAVSPTAGVNALPVVSLKGNYFQRNGKPFLPVGVNWVPAKAAMEWPYQWDPISIEKDFAQMHQLGVNIVRLDLVWAWFEPRPGVYNPRAWKELDFLVSLANRYKIYLHPELLVGGEVGEAYWDVPYRNGRNPQSDPYMPHQYIRREPRSHQSCLLASIIRQQLPRKSTPFFRRRIGNDFRACQAEVRFVAIWLRPLVGHDNRGIGGCRLDTFKVKSSCDTGKPSEHLGSWPLLAVPRHNAKLGFIRGPQVGHF